jgi:hypothetical protein
MILVEYTENGCDNILSIDASDSRFDRFTPKDFEGTLCDDSGDYCAWFDDFGNLHWLVKLTTGHISYKSVNCNNLIDELINEKL